MVELDVKIVLALVCMCFKAFDYLSIVLGARCSVDGGALNVLVWNKRLQK